ncbi:solute carrier family 46, member 1 [Elysia marginata]|uniref:Solute carrier family 46, member 1 n=1 Tax=Elysia marginata TaxID=1093978 RepID=A0AAV4F0F9_9GAST|nr:solute carrier family 46, member 1 [Elysia marginata]
MPSVNHQISGTLLKQIVYIIVVTRKLPIPYLYLAHAIEALGGSFAAMLAAIFSVTSDLTQSGIGRSRWIAFMEAVQTLSATGGQIYTAQWMRFSYLSPLICALGSCCVTFLLATFLLPETQRDVSGSDSSQSENESYEARVVSCRQWVLQVGRQCWKTIRTSVSIYTKNDTGSEISTTQPNNLFKRRLCMAIFVCTVAVNFSRPGVEALFQIKYPLCWAATKVYTFTGLRIFFSWVAILCALFLVQRVFNMADRHVAIIGVISSLLSNAALSLAVNDAMVYEAAVIGFMTRSIIPMLRSTLSSLVAYSNQGAMYSSLSCVESLGAGVFSTAANRIYYSTLSSWAGEIFMIFACIMGIALTLIVILNIIFVRDARRNDNNLRQAGNIQENTPS